MDSGRSFMIGRDPAKSNKNVGSDKGRLSEAISDKLSHMEQALAPFLEQAGLYLRHARAANTLRAYRSDWSAFENFCRAHDLHSLPSTPAAVAAFAADTARTLKANTVERRL